MAAAIDVKIKSALGCTNNISLQAKELHFMPYAESHLQSVDLHQAKEIQIIFYPNEGGKDWRYFTGQHWFKRSSHQLLLRREAMPDLNTLYPLHGLSEKFEEALRCLELLCRYLATRIVRQSTNLAFDFIAFAPADAVRLLDCLQSIAPLKQVALEISGFTYPTPTGWEMPAGGRRVIQDLIAQRAQRLVAPIMSIGLGAARRSPAFPFMKLPPELREMALSHAVVDDSMVPIQTSRTRSQSHFHRLHAKRCCGGCRAIEIENDYTCRCINSESYSTSCRCVFLSDGIFLASKEIRSEALRLYWQSNTFLVHGPMGDKLKAERTTVETLLCSVPKAYLKLIRHLVIDTDWYFQGFEAPASSLTDYLPRVAAWGSVLRYLSHNSGPRLSVEIRSSNKLGMLMKGSYTWRQFYVNGGSSTSVGSANDIANERQRFKHDVGELNLRVKALETESDGSETVVVDHRPSFWS